MTRFLLIVLTLAALLHAKSSVDARIASTGEALRNFDRNYAKINKKMSQTAKEILRRQQNVLDQRRKIETLENELAGKATQLENARHELQKLTGTQEKLESSQKALVSELSELMARALSLKLMHDDANTLSVDSILGEAVFESLYARTREAIRELGSRYEENGRRLKNLTGKTAALRTEIARIEQQKKKLLAAKKENEKALKSLRAKKKSYKKEIRKLLAQKEELQKTLRRLHIIRRTEEQRARAEAERRRNEALLASKPATRVKSVGSSYKRAKTRRYRGRKTIAPLERYTVTKRYGTYTDPIYKIKIFNESVTLKPRSPDAKVRAIFNGRVILAQNMPLLENVVIIEHANGLHTIYAHLDRIAPTVKKGKRLKKGSIIGRVSDELMFEVTQKNYHIDPLQVIR